MGYSITSGATIAVQHNHAATALGQRASTPSPVHATRVLIIVGSGDLVVGHQRMRVSALQLMKLPLIFLNLLLYVLFVVLYVNELRTHLGHNLSVPQGA